MGEVQDGIYSKKNSRPGDSLGIIFLRASITLEAEELGQIVRSIWETCVKLRKGVIKDLEVDYPEYYKDLTVLIGYSPKVFKLNGVRRKKPSLLTDDISFMPARRGGGLIFPSSDLTFHEDIAENHAALDDVVIQFISDKQYVTHQALVEVWRALAQGPEGEVYSDKLGISAFYDGFRRADNRNWTGFHDGVSNLKTEDRDNVIFIGQSQVHREDNWLKNGTFMSFIRIFVDLQNWWKKKTHEQELMVGRLKSTGCPIIGYDKENNPIADKNCPVRGTREVTDKGNEMFRNHPSYGFQRLPPGTSDDKLRFSHIGAMKIIENATRWQNRIEKNSIYRQGFEFLEQTNTYPGLRAGLNFISFQNDPRRLFNTLTNWSLQKSVKSTKGSPQDLSLPPRLQLNSYFRVGAAGIYLVPPHDDNEVFPGSSIFTAAKNGSRITHPWKH